MKHEHTSQIIRQEESDRPLPDPCPGGYTRYRDFESLAEGGGAILETGVDDYFGRRVVFKKLLPEFRDNPGMLQRFIREARVTARIQHPSTVPVYELGRDETGTPYFTMKKVSGHSLQEILQGIIAHDPTFRPFATRDRLIDILIQVGLALANAHECGVVHRDIKPANILVGEFGEVLIMDWGVAKVYDNSDTSLTDPHSDFHATDDGLTVHGKIYGTPRYMSPEQAKGETDIDLRSDIFSLGAVLYEVLTRRPLFYGADRKEILHQVLHRRIQSPRKLEPLKNIPLELNAICMQALQKHPDDRYASMDDFIEDLQRYRRNEPVSVLTTTPWLSFINWQHRTVGRAGWFMLIAGTALGWWLGKHG